jgi:hypothetical protein
MDARRMVGYQTFGEARLERQSGRGDVVRGGGGLW